MRVSYNVTANVDDAAGNAAPVATRPITLTDTTAPTISINVIAGDDVVDDSEDNAVTGKRNNDECRRRSNRYSKY